MRFLFSSSKTGLKKVTTLQAMIPSILFIKYEIFFPLFIHVRTHMFCFFRRVQYQYTKGLICKVMLSRLAVLRDTQTFPCSNTQLKNSFWKPSKTLFCRIYFLFSPFSFSSNKLCVFRGMRCSQWWFSCRLKPGVALFCLKVCSVHLGHSLLWRRQLQKSQRLQVNNFWLWIRFFFMRGAEKISNAVDLFRIRGL